METHPLQLHLRPISRRRSCSMQKLASPRPTPLQPGPGMVAVAGPLRFPRSTPLHPLLLFQAARVVTSSPPMNRIARRSAHTSKTAKERASAWPSTLEPATMVKNARNPISVPDAFRIINLLMHAVVTPSPFLRRKDQRRASRKAARRPSPPPRPPRCARRTRCARATSARWSCSRCDVFSFL